MAPVRPSEARLRLDPEDAALLEQLAKDLSLTKSGVVRLALRTLARALHTPTAPSAAEIAAQRRRPGGRPGPRPSRAYTQRPQT